MSIKGSSGIEHAIDHWAAADLPEAESDEAKEAIEFMKRVAHALAKKIVKWLKMARVGLTVRIAAALILTYEDIMTDILVSLEFKETGRDGFFRTSVGALALAIFLHTLVAWLDSAKKPPKVSFRRFLVSFSMLSPIMDAYNVWTGKDTDKDLMFTPDEALVMSRVIELVFENLPESVLQTYNLLNTAKSDIAPITIFSIMASLAAAAFIMCDSSISHERSYMGSHQGPYVHPIFGYIPAKTHRQVGLYTGMFSFYVGYFSMNVLAYTTLATYFHILLIPIMVIFELCVYGVAQYWRGGLLYFRAPLENEI